VYRYSLPWRGATGPARPPRRGCWWPILRREGRKATLVREPGATPLGDHLREYLKSNRRISPRAELLLFEAARAQLVEEVIRPSMEQGVSVVSDRFAASSIAYQGHGREIGVRWVQQINDFATQALYPHLNILLEVPPAAGLWRARAAQAAAMSKQERKPGEDGEDSRRFEEEPTDFHRRVMESYRTQAADDPGRWAVIDGTMTAELVEKAVWERVSGLL
jgi:dTMP kinase